MEIKTKPVAHLSHRDGISRSSCKEWSVDSFLFDDEREYPQRFVGDVWKKELAEWLKTNLNKEASVSFDLEAREYNGKWYNSIRVFKVSLNGVDVLNQKSDDEMRVESYFPTQAPPPTEKEDEEPPF